MPQPIESRRIHQAGPYAVVADTPPLAAIPPYAVLDDCARELERFARAEDAIHYAALLARRR